MRAILWLLAAHDAQAGRLNWIGAANDLSVGGSPAFTADRGYQGDGSAAYLASGYLFPAGYQDSAHLMVWSRSGAAERRPTIFESGAERGGGAGGGGEASAGAAAATAARAGEIFHGPKNSRATRSTAAAAPGVVGLVPASFTSRERGCTGNS